MLKIAHLSDIQIRNFKRHDEFRQSFENLYKSLREEYEKGFIDFIVLVGDIAHTKTQISPEFVQLCSEFFTNLAKVSPLIIVPGNHDGNLNNLSRLDALTPIVEALNSNRIFYFKKSGVYEIPFLKKHCGNREAVSFVHFSCFDSDWPTKKDIPKGAINIGLYHGFVQGAVLQNNQMVIDGAPKVQDFLKMVDYLMLGDIHKMQILDSKYRAAYCGSFPQQNYGESVEKGYLLWNIKSKTEHTVDFIQLPNVCPFYTLQLDNDDLLSFAKYNIDIQPKARIRVFSRQLTISEKDLLKQKIHEKYNPIELKFIDDISGHRQEISLKKVNATIENLNEIAVQEKLIKVFLKSYKLSKEVLAEVFEINKRYNAHVRKNDDTLRNIQCRIEKVWWENFCSFGQNNEFDFTTKKGTLGVFGKNGSGKSTIAADIPAYCLFNKVTKRITKNDLLINENENYCNVGMEIGVGKDRYVINRDTTVYVKSGKKKGKPIIQGKTDVDFKLIKEDGTEEDKNGEERSVTDSEIRRTFGTYDDFIATSVAPQWQLLDFIDKGGTERQKLIGRYFDIDIFAQKHQLAKEDIREIKTKLKMFDGISWNENIDECRKDLAFWEKQLKYWGSSKEQKQKQLKELDKSIERCLSKIKAVGGLVSASNIDERIAELSEQIEKQTIKVTHNKNEIEAITKRIQKTKQKLKEIDIQKVVDGINYYETLCRHIQDVSRDKSMCFDNMSQAFEKLTTLRDHPCASRDTCCMLSEIREAEKTKDDFDYQYANIAKKLEKLKNTKETYDIGKLQEDRTQFEKTQKQLESDEISLNSQPYQLKSEQTILEQLKEKLANLKKDKKTIETNKKQLEKNNKYNEKLTEFKQQKVEVEKELNLAVDQIIQASSGKSNAETSLSKVLKDQEEYKQLQKEYEAYDYFLQVTGKEGISQLIIRDNLDVINKQISRILSNGVDFDIYLDSPEGKEIEVYFKSRKSPARRIESCSGMEKTLAAIAIRAALISVTTLPKFNIFVLDEVFGSLDLEYMDAVTKMLDYLKLLFDTVVIITHIDSMKDVVDHVVEIERDSKGYSRVCE